MTSVNITTNKNTVTVNEGNTTVVEVATQGPAGPSGSIAGLVFDVTGKVNDALLYYEASSNTFKADNTTTKLTLVDGGNF